MILQNNWLYSQLGQIEMMDDEAKLKLQFCSEQELNITKPKLTKIKEIPFMKNDPKALERAQEASGDGAPLTEKQKRIAELKKNLLAPM